MHLSLPLLFPRACMLSQPRIQTQTSGNRIAPYLLQSNRSRFWMTTRIPVFPTIPMSTPWLLRQAAALRIRADNPELLAASKALFEYPYSDFSPEHTRWRIDRKAQLKREQGNQYFSRILDRLGIETAMANRVAMPDYLDKKRFLWTFFVDSFLFPFDNTNIKAQNGDQQVYIPLQEKRSPRVAAGRP